MALEILPAVDFRGVHASGSLAQDAIATAAVSAVWAAEIGATQRWFEIIAEAFAGDGSAAAATAGSGTGCRGYAGNRRKAPASRDVARLRAARILSAGECSDGPGAGRRGLRSGQPGGPALLRRPAGTRRRGRWSAGAGAALHQCVRAGRSGHDCDERGGLWFEHSGGRA